jgi:hypothetical protein
MQIGTLGEPGQEGVQGQRPALQRSIIGTRGAGFRPGGGYSGGLGMEGSGRKSGQGKTGETKG